MSLKNYEIVIVHCTRVFYPAGSHVHRNILILLHYLKWSNRLKWKRLIYSNFRVSDRQQVFMKGQSAQKAERFLWGRQLEQMMYEYFRATSTHESIRDISDVMYVTLLSVETTFKNVIRDGMTHSYPQKKFLKITFWNVHTNFDDGGPVQSQDVEHED